jgi:hypothetical protein
MLVLLVNRKCKSGALRGVQYSYIRYQQTGTWYWSGDGQDLIVGINASFSFSSCHLHRLATILGCHFGRMVIVIVIIIICLIVYHCARHLVCLLCCIITSSRRIRSVAGGS